MGAINAVSNLLPILGAATSAVRTVEGAITTLGSIGQGADNSAEKMALKQLKQRQKLEERQAAQSADLQRQQLALQTAQSDEERRQALRRAVARQRAQFGASGVTPTGGSADAVLLGLFNESDD